MLIIVSSQFIFSKFSVITNSITNKFSLPVHGKFLLEMSTRALLTKWQIPVGSPQPLHLSHHLNSEQCSQKAGTGSCRWFYRDKAGATGRVTE